MTPEQEQASGELAKALKPRTSLYDIVSEIAELIELQETAETDEVRLATEQALEAYRETLPQKVDDVRGYIKHCEMMAECARQESQEQAARARLWGNRAQRLKDYAVGAMQAVGAKKLSGRTGDLRLQGNPPSVEITREDLLPLEYMRVTLSMSGMVWDLLAGFLDRFRAVVATLSPLLSDHWYLSLPAITRTPDKAAIAAALKQECPFCHGDLTMRRALGLEGADIVCDQCNGTGKATVPGARLVTDRAHLRL